MTIDRVDKRWASKGLTSYPAEAILNTLKHYGVDTSQSAFTAEADRAFPLDFARNWTAQWKGTGQFASFPLAAADELWHRWVPKRLSPDHLAGEIFELMGLLTAAQSPPPEVVSKAFEVLEGHKADVPASGDLREHFVAEFVFRLDEGLTTFNRLAETLASEGRIDDAKRFVAFEEFLFPVREGSASALVQAAMGEKAAAISELVKIADDAKRDVHARLSAVDALLHLEAVSEAKPVTLALLETAQASKDLDLAMEIAERLRFIANALGPTPERAELLGRVMALIDELEGHAPGQLVDEA